MGGVQQERYLFGSTHYYERAIYSSDPRDQIPAILRETPPGYRRISSEAWVEYTPLQCDMPKQGWKAHVSGTPKNYSSIIEIVTDFCFRRNMVFKVVPNLRSLVIGNSKSAPRESSGKLATIYARDEAEFEAIVKGLTPLLTGFDGPYILSDLQIEDSQLYVRYGAFSKMLCATKEGIALPAIENPNGAFEPDPRLPVFRPPEWSHTQKFYLPPWRPGQGRSNPSSLTKSSRYCTILTPVEFTYAETRAAQKGK